MSHDVVKDWTTKAGLRAVVLFIHNSHHCGYVAITKDHPLYGVTYNTPHPALRREALENEPIGKRGILPVFCSALREEDTVRPDVFFNVHGSITYSDDGEDGYPAKGAGLWWFGYDCSHAGDLRLKDRELGYADPDSVFRDADYCISECESLAAQLEAVREVAARSAV